MSLFKWSRTAASNGTADSSCPFPEGMAASALNDGARGMMAAAAKFRDDISGAIVTGGTSTAYTVASYQVFDSLAHLDGQMIAFTPHATNGAGPVTLNQDGLGAKALRASPGVELPSGTLIQGTPYVATYNNSDSAYYLQGGVSNPYNIPLGAGIDYWGTTAPNSSFVFPFGQAISRTTYSTLFSLFSTTFGVGDGSTTFNVPDLRGRIAAIKDNMGGSAASRLTSGGSGVDGATLGANGGEQTHTLTAGELASHTHSGTTGNDSPDHTHTPTSGEASNFSKAAGATGIGPAGTGGTSAYTYPATNGASTRHQHPFTTDGGAVSGFAHNNTQPTIVCNYILRII